MDPEEEFLLESQGELPPGYIKRPPHELVLQPPAINPFSVPENDEAEAV